MCVSRVEVAGQEQSPCCETQSLDDTLAKINILMARQNILARGELRFES